MSDELGMEEILAQSVEAEPGAIIEGVIVSQTSDSLIVDVGLKQEASLSLKEFGHKIPQTGEKISVLLVRMSGPEGRPLVSWRQARERTHWDRIAEAHKNNAILDGVVTKRIKGGVQVDIGLDAFMPASQMDERPVNKPEEWVGKPVQVRVLEMDRAKGNVLVSRRKVLDDEKAKKRVETLSQIKPDSVVKGKVKSLTNFGAFVDIGGVEGLLHVSDLAWTKVNHPKNVLKVGEEIEVKVIKYDTETQRVSLGRKQLLPHPWDGIEKKYTVGSSIKGRVTAFASFGAFVEIEPGIEGLIHLTEISWTERVKSPKDKLKIGQDVEAKVVGLDRKEEKISLSLKRLHASPWEEAAKQYPVGTKVEGTVSHIANFGAFIKIPLGIEGLLKTQDLSWVERIQSPSQVLKVNQTITVVVLELDVKKEKMSLGLKQVNADPLRQLKVGSVVEGTISKVAEFGLFVKLPSGLEGLIRKSEMHLDRSMFDAGDRKKKSSPSDGPSLENYKEGDSIKAAVTKINKKDRKLDLSVRRYERDQEKALLKKYSSESGRPTLGEATGWTGDL